MKSLAVVLDEITGSAPRFVRTDFRYSQSSTVWHISSPLLMFGGVGL